ncbi:hypothetical protein L211DRAFT_844804 [Terfezia boudieri ATCC MYA-4762]|uniref:Uncharacterized protein n=1 Tax=Terfezia boudieri ATCC MYA-4762 TaxID=1051890 RepID=A0A3N4M4D8_9PEZI|nr:hypothetical protein L211DRAFT_844804 [Terfezia boudieri ATCC MYA-4762]
METLVLVELMLEVVPHWARKIERYIQEAENSQKSGSGIIITSWGVEISKDVPPDCDGTSTRRVISTPGIVATNGVTGVAMPPPSPTTLTYGGAEPSDNIATQFKKGFGLAHGASRLDARPDSKSRFSSLTSPAVMYDGESQQMLCDMWTALNNKRGALRAEMMAIRGRQQMAALPPPRPMFEAAIESEDGDGSGDDDDDEDMEHSAEMLRLRLKMEREKMKRMNRRGPPGMTMTGASSPGIGPLQFRRARIIGAPPGAAPPTPPGSQQGEKAGPGSIDDEKLKEFLEAVDDNLDRTCKVIETVAFVWLKGDSYDGHLKFILARLKDTVEKIEKSGLVSSRDKPEEKSAEATVVAMGPPKTPPPTGRISPRMEISKKKSDHTMRDAPILRPSQVVPPMEKQIERKDSGSSSDDTVVPSLESMCRPLVRPVGDKLQPDVLEVDDDDDEGIGC